jgi:outer membrane phospholipase A
VFGERDRLEKLFVTYLHKSNGKQRFDFVNGFQEKLFYPLGERLQSLSWVFGYLARLEKVFVTYLHKSNGKHRFDFVKGFQEKFFDPPWRKAPEPIMGVW